MRTFEELKAEVLENPEVRAEYERLRPEFELAEAIIAAKEAHGLTLEKLAASDLQVDDPMVNAKLNAYSNAVSIYMAKVESWNSYVQAQMLFYETQFLLSLTNSKI